MGVGPFRAPAGFMPWCTKGRMEAQIGIRIAEVPLHQRCMEYVSPGEHCAWLARTYPWGSAR